MGDPSENCRKLNSSKLSNMILKVKFPFFISLSLFIIASPPSTMVNGQPFLNSLAVLFRARPPWPTTFPSSKFTAIPSPLLSPSGSHQGILVAHPINPSPSNSASSSSSSNTGTNTNFDSFDSSNTNSNSNSNSNTNSNTNAETSKSKKPDTVSSPIDTSSHSAQTPVPSPQQNFVPIASTPTISPPIPAFPPLIPMFHNHGQHSHHGGRHHNHIILHPGLPPGTGPLHKLQKIPTPHNAPILLSSPTSLVGSIAYPPDPPTTASNPHYGMLLENSNNNHHHYQKHHHAKLKHHKHYRDNAWNPLWITASQTQNDTSSQTGQPPQRTLSSHQTTNPQNDVITKENARRQKKLKDFRPSPQLNSFVETTLISDYATHVKANDNNNPTTGTNNGDRLSSKEHRDKQLMTEAQPGQAPLAHYPRFESGFRPISFNQYAAQYGTTATRPHYTNSQQQYFNPWSIAFDPNNPATYQNQQGVNQYMNGRDGSTENYKGGQPFRQDRQIVTGTMSQSVVTTAADVSVEEGSTEEEEEGNGDGEFVYNRGKKKSSGEHNRGDNRGKSRHRFSAKGKKYQHRGLPTSSSTTASSELVEEWLPPNLRIQKKSDGRRKYPTFAKKNHRNIPKTGSASKEQKPKGKMNLPDKCDKFGKFGFCPVTRQYPLDAAEKIASRCSALLSHLIAPLPKMDVQYDIAVEGGKNSTTKGRSTGWSWKSYQGKPVCDTDELTTVPGWAKNEYGDWMIILQTKLWQQKAHISLCSPSATHCQGLICNNSNKKSESKTSKEKGIDMTYTKCVQRFTAQRLAVFDPDNPDFCPVVRSVFLPSACVCLTSTGGLNSGSGSSSIEKTNQPSSGFLGRQPLFSSNSNEEEVTGKRKEEEEDQESRVNPKPVDSRETLTSDKSTSTKNSNSNNNSTGKAKPVGPVYVYPASGITSRESRKSHQHASNSFESSSPLLSNGTFMIITEKFTTNESSKETTDVVLASTTDSDDSSSTPKTDNGTTTSS